MSIFCRPSLDGKRKEDLGVVPTGVEVEARIDVAGDAGTAEDAGRTRAAATGTVRGGLAGLTGVVTEAATIRLAGLDWEGSLVGRDRLRRSLPALPGS